jgi:hypothetical protein
MTTDESVGTTVLFRPAGTAELRLIEESGWRALRPRLEGPPTANELAGWKMTKSLRDRGSPGCARRRA